MSEEKPPFLFFNGEIVPWEKAQVHIWSETAIRATNVFEGLRAYYCPDRDGWQLIAWPAHRQRLFQSARLMRLAHRFEPKLFDEAIPALLRRLDYRTHVFLRPTIYVEEGRYEYRVEHTKAGCYVVGFPVPRSGQLKASRCLVSTWERFDDGGGAPPRIKAGSSYQNFRFPRIEAHQRGFDDAIMLNQRGNVAELTGATMFLVRGSRVITPPFSSGILESITRDIVIRILADLDYEVVEREVERTELYVADEIFSAGTLSEIGAVVQVDDLAIGGGQAGVVTERVFQRYCEMTLSNHAERYGIAEFLPRQP